MTTNTHHCPFQIGDKVREVYAPWRELTVESVEWNNEYYAWRIVCVTEDNIVTVVLGHNLEWID